MAQKIFVASASENIDSHAVPIAQALSDEGFEAKRWWKGFKPGDVTLDRLVHLSNEVQGAVFICTGIDRTWYRNEKTMQARDNVIFELGMFLNRLEPDLAVVISDGDTKLPSDLEGITYIPAGQDIQTVAERVVTHFKDRFQKLPRPSPSPQVIRIEVDPVLGEISLNKSAPAGWHQRALYLGTEGARGWMAVANYETYLTPGDRDRIRRNILDVLDDKSIHVSTFVSLGPGDAETDREVAIHLSSTAGLKYYVPVDISEGLLFNASRKLSGHVDVPMGVLSDFEERLPFVLDRLTLKTELPQLVGLLGYTLGNLDRFEGSLLRQLEQSLSCGDYVLLEVLIANENFDVSSQRLPDHPGAR